MKTKILLLTSALFVTSLFGESLKIVQTFNKNETDDIVLVSNCLTLDEYLQTLKYSRNLYGRLKSIKIDSNFHLILLIRCALEEFGLEVSKPIVEKKSIFLEIKDHLPFNSDTEDQGFSY